MSADTSQHDDHDDLRMTLAEIGAALTNDDLALAEAQAKELLSDIRREKREGRR